MSVRYNKKTDRWDVRVQKDGVRVRHGSYETYQDALLKEGAVKCENDVMDYEHMGRGENKVTKPRRWNFAPFKAFRNRV